ncbi:MAG: nucleotidyltransferase domain-containing protein, partial [Candidatus Norongarragalinales archaeon]
MESSDTEETHKAIEKIAEIVSRKVSPSPAEAAAEKKFAATLSRKLAAKLGREAEINFVGSAARDTGLAGDRDIDLFVAFPVSRDREYIIRKTISATKSAVKAKWEMHYAEHP